MGAWLMRRREIAAAQWSAVRKAWMIGLCSTAVLEDVERRLRRADRALDTWERARARMRRSADSNTADGGRSNPRSHRFARLTR